MPTIQRPLSAGMYHDSRYYRSDIGNLTLLSTAARYKLSRSDLRTTLGNQNWKAIIARGGDACNAYENIVINYSPMRLNGTSHTYPLVAGTNHFARGSDRQSPTFDPSNIVFTADNNALKDQALARLKRKLSDHSKQVNLLVPLVELREFRGLIRGTAELTTGLLRNLLAIKATGGRSAFKHASKSWLTFSFGISPMINESKQIAESIAAYLTRRDHSVRLTGAASADWKSSITPFQRTGLFHANSETSADVRHTLSYKYIAGFDLNLRSANNYGVSEHFGLEFGNLIPTFWELIPYSWAIDYFTTVGAYLDDTFSSDASTTRYVVLNKRYTCTARITGRYVASPGTRVLTCTCVPGKYDYFSFSRTKLATLPTRACRIKTFDEIGNHAVNKLLNLASLLGKRG